MPSAAAPSSVGLIVAAPVAVVARQPGRRAWRRRASARARRRRRSRRGRRPGAPSRCASAGPGRGRRRSRCRRRCRRHTASRRRCRGCARRRPTTGVAGAMTDEAERATGPGLGVAREPAPTPCRACRRGRRAPPRPSLRCRAPGRRSSTATRPRRGPTRPSAATTVESVRIPSREPTSIVTLRPPSALRSVATTRAGTRVRPVVALEPSSSSSRPSSSRRCCCSAATARSRTFSLSTAASSSRGAPGEGALHGPEHEPAGPAHPVGDGPAGEVGDEQREGERGEDDEEAAADGRAACD